MELINWTKLYEKYKGLWVALSEDNETVVGSGPTAKEALDQAHRNGFEDAALTYVPTEMIMKFPYTKFPQGIKRPIIRIAIEHKGKELPYFGLIDSGADINLFHGELAELLGLDLEAGEKRSVGGIIEGERREYYVHRVTLKIGGWRHDNVMVGFMPSLSKSGHGLLGQYDFFDLYSVKFDLPKGEIELKPHADADRTN